MKEENKTIAAAAAVCVVLVLREILEFWEKRRNIFLPTTEIIRRHFGSALQGSSSTSSGWIRS